MTLGAQKTAAFLAHRQIRQDEFAATLSGLVRKAASMRQHRVGQGTVSKLVTGKRRSLRPWMMEALQAATEGFIRPGDFYLPAVSADEMAQLIERHSDAASVRVAGGAGGARVLRGPRAPVSKNGGAPSSSRGHPTPRAPVSFDDAAKKKRARIEAARKAARTRKRVKAARGKAA